VARSHGRATFVRSLVRLVLDIPWGNAQLENSTLPVSSLPSIATETRPPVVVNLRRNPVLDEEGGQVS
jgi:hypothetical protein